MMTLKTMAMSWMLQGEQRDRGALDLQDLLPHHPSLYSHEEHELHGRSRAEQLREGIHKEVVGKQQELHEQHQAVVAGLEHPPSRGLEPSAPAFPMDHGAGGGSAGPLPIPRTCRGSTEIGMDPKNPGKPSELCLPSPPQFGVFLSPAVHPNPHVRKSKDEGDMQSQAAESKPVIPGCSQPHGQF